MSADAILLDARRLRLDGLLRGLELVRDPFPVTPDYESYFFSPRLRARYEELLGAVALRKGFALITGDVGVGKTTLVRLLIHAMQGQGVRSALVINTFVQGQELLRVINRDFGLAGQAQTIEGLLEELHAFLLEQYAAGANCVLVIDDAQALTVDSLELLRQISNLETTRHKLIQLVLVGQPELLDLLGRGDLRQLRSRIAMHLQLEPMSLQEMDAYLYHRLESAGNGAAFTVDTDALRLLWERTGGYPRRVHLVMDRCLFGALARKLRRVDRGLMREAIAEVALPARAGQPGQPDAPGSRREQRRNWVAWAAAAMMVVSVGVALFRLEVLSLPAPEALAAQVRPLLARVAALAAPGESLAGTVESETSLRGAGGATVAETVPAVASAADKVAAHALFAQIPEPVWVAFWAGLGGAPALAALPADTPAALAELDRHVAGRGLRSMLLQGAVEACAEHAALHMAPGGGQTGALFVLAEVPRGTEPIEFGRTSGIVRWAQGRLRAHGLLQAEHVDALLGPVTVAALAHFQRAEGLPATGLLDDATLYRLSCAAMRGAGASVHARGRP